MLLDKSGFCVHETILVYQLLRSTPISPISALNHGHLPPDNRPPRTEAIGQRAASQIRQSRIFRDTGCKRTADRLSLLLARRPGTHFLTV